MQMESQQKNNVIKRYRIYIDESGDHTESKADDFAKRYLALLGCIIETDYYRNVFQPSFEEFKRKHFKYDADEPIILHRNEIINKKGIFKVLQDSQRKQTFNDDLLRLFSSSSFTIICVVIDKYAHNQRYASPFHPYHYCLAAILERYCIFLNSRGARGDVMAEKRGGEEDGQLKGAYRNIYHNGTLHQPKENFQKTLTSVEIKLKPKEKNIAGLQLADLLAYPIKQEILIENGCISTVGDVFGRKICEAIKDKYDRHFYTGETRGCGKVFIK